MIHIRWSKRADADLEAIRLSEYRWQIAMAARGLARFPRRGRTPPECQRFPELNFSPDLREIVFPDLARLFCRFDEARQTIFVLGMALRGMDVTPEWLIRLPEQ